MKIRGNISSQFLQITLGLFVGLFVLTQTSYISSTADQKDSKEQSDSSEGEKQQIKRTEAVPSASTQINLDFQSFLIETVEFDDESEEVKSPTEKLIPSANKALKILLRRIISPNAP